MTFYSYPVTSQRLPEGKQRLQAERRTIAIQKSMLTAMLTSNTFFWLHDFKLQKGGINAEYYIDDILKTVKQNMIHHLPIAQKQKVRMVIENVPVHNSNMTKEFLQDSIFQRIDHPLYSIDFAPYDFWLFGEMKGRTRGHIFETQLQLADFCTEFAENQSEDRLKSVLDDWQSRRLKTIDNGWEQLF
ncbi:MAG: hypothetical protein EZS28_021732 [Streblomastix strix]|uniref:Tc1-like transposase DDE domain-containing protein n=1 Tax=Streblomastix strix TaxID=222440 RepID=A0A5J4VJG2_9EUKA|nr:MAG: hypothetical protein EZS28_021732 [Streblomastix strix]